MKTLIFAGSLRTDSLNKKLAKWIEKIIPQTQEGATSTCIDLKALQIPVYDADLEVLGMPAGVTELCQQITTHDGVIICTPEYNGSIPGVLKNAFDWVSRVPPNCLNRKHVMLMAASPGALGGIRGLWHTRVPLETLGAFVHPQMYGLGKANEKLSGENNLNDEKAAEQIQKIVSIFLNDAAAKN